MHISILRLAIVVISLISTHAFSQVTTTTYESIAQRQHFCASDDVPHKETLAPIQQQLDQQWHAYITEHPSGTGARSTYVLPVVFHIIHDGGAENISDADVLASLALMNRAFENTGYYDQGVGADADIEFCLAKQDPEGNATTGINRIQSTLTNMDANTDDQAVKDLIRWDPTQYINIWIVKEICRGTECGVAGYAYFPSAHGQPYDGILVEAGYMGASPANNSVLIHEMGHYLGLYHTFEGGCTNNNCQTDGDQVCDTPPDATTARPPCYAPANSCTSDEDDTSTNNPFRPIANGGLGDQVDMHENFMDYSDLACYHAFTQGQSDRMQFFINDVRFSLLQSNACNTPCTNLVTATINTTDMTIDVGSTFNFDGQTANASSWEWRINNSVEGSNEDLTYQFDTEGNYEIIFTASSSDPLCLNAADTVYFIVSCPAEANFAPSIDDCYRLDTTINFTNTSTNYTSLQWILNDTIKGSSESIALFFGMAGRNKLELVVTNGICTDTIRQSVNISCNEICDNGFDDDGDGFVDYYDPDCCGTNEHFNFICDEPCAEPQPFNYDVGLEWTSERPTTGLFLPVAGDIDADGVVEMAIVYNYDREIAIFDGRDGSLERIISHPGGQLAWTIALADINNDGFGEIISATRDGYLVAFDYLGNLLFQSNERISYFIFQSFGTNYDIYLEIADFNQDGNPEIYAGNRIFNGQTGELITGGGSSNNFGLGQNDQLFDDNWQKYLTVAIDILPDDFCPDCKGLELVAGNQVYSVNIDDGTMQVVVELPGKTDGFTYVADYDQDGDLDVVSLANDPLGSTVPYHHVFVWDGQTPALMQEWIWMELRNYQIGGLVLGNLDLDPELEVCFKVDQFLIALDNDFSVMWRDSVNDGSAAQPLGFDFNYDGILEIAYRDDLNLGIYAGATGDTLFMQEARSATVADAIGIADMDGDGSAEIIMDAFSGARCYGIISGPSWADARPVFNQPHFYNIHINDDLSVPAEQQDPTIVYDRKIINNSNTAMTIPQPSTDARLVIDSFYCSPNGIEVLLEVCNTGLINLPANLGYTIYCQAPNNLTSQQILTDNIVPSIAPDSCRQMWVTVPSGSCSDNFVAVLNDDGSIMPPFNILEEMPINNFTECNYLNNIDSFHLNIVPVEVEILGDTVFCENGMAVLYAAQRYANYLWNTNSIDSFINVTAEGWYWLEVAGSCGDTYRDSVYVREIPSVAFNVNIGNDTTICTSAVMTLSAPTGPYTYRWNTGEVTNSITIWESNSYSVTVTDACGQSVSDSIRITMSDVPPISIGNDTTICVGDTILLNMPQTGIYSWGPEQSVSCASCASTKVFPIAQTTYTGVFTNADGCVVMDSITVYIDSAYSIMDTLMLCTGDSVFVGDRYVDMAGVYTYIAVAPGCDTAYTFVVEEQNIQILDSIELCAGDTAYFHGNPLVAPGQISYSVSSTMTCDSLFTITAFLTDTLRSSDTYTACRGDSITVNAINYYRDTTLVFQSASSSGCDSIAEVSLVFSSTEIDFPDDVTIMSGEQTELSVSILQGMIDSIRWNPNTHISCDDCFDVTASPDATISYSIRIVDSDGCAYSEEVTVQVLAQTNYYIPTAFSPNDDAINDRFAVFGQADNDATYSMKIFNRWGNKLFDRDNLTVNELSQGWDGTANGKLLTPDVYVYHITIATSAGIREYTGEVQLIR